MAELIDKGALVKKFKDKGVHIEFDLPVEEILGEDVDIDDFSMLVQDAIQAYRGMVIDTIRNLPTVTEAEIRNKAIDEMVGNLIRNSRTEVVDGKVCFIVTDRRIVQIAEQLKGK